MIQNKIRIGLIIFVLVLFVINAKSQDIRWEKPIKAGMECNSLVIDNNNMLYFALIPISTVV